MFDFEEVSKTNAEKSMNAVPIRSNEGWVYCTSNYAWKTSNSSIFCPVVISYRFACVRGIVTEWFLLYQLG